MFKLNLELLKKANECKGNEDIRFYLNGVFVKYSEEKKQMVYAGTNGHILYKGVEDVDYEFEKEELKILEKGIILFANFKKLRNCVEILSCEFIKEDCLLMKCQNKNKCFYFVVRILQGNSYVDYDKIIIPNIDNTTKKYNQKNIKVSYNVFDWLLLEKMKKMGADLYQPIKWVEEKHSPYRFNINDKELIILMPIKDPNE